MSGQTGQRGSGAGGGEGRRFMLRRGDNRPFDVDSRYWFAVKRLVTGQSVFDPATGEPSTEAFQGEIDTVEGRRTITGWVEEPP